MKTLLVPTDFSPPADNAVDYAMHLAVLLNCKVVLLNAYFPVTAAYFSENPLANFEAGFPLETEQHQKELITQNLERLRLELSKKFYLDLEKIDCIAKMGSPDEVIDSVANECHADLIVMGITGEAGILKQHLVGSTALKVARNQNLPTFIIPEDIKYSPIQKLSYACDFDAEENDLLYHAKYFSKIFDAELEVVNVEKPEEFELTEKIELNSYIESELKRVKHKVTYLEGDKIAEQLEEHFRKSPTNVILLNPRKHNPLYYLFNHSITKELAFNAKTPILTIK